MRSPRLDDVIGLGELQLFECACKPTPLERFTFGQGSFGHAACLLTVN